MMSALPLTSLPDACHAAETAAVEATHYEPCVLLKLGEIVLKGKNRQQFERMLHENIRRAVRDLGVQLWQREGVIVLRVTGGRPAFLLNRDAHGAWASTRALELAGIDAGTADPPDGRIEREPGGGPQGSLHEGASTLVAALVPPVSAADRLAGLLLAQAHLHARGVTAWQDAIVGDYLGSADPLPRCV